MGKLEGESLEKASGPVILDVAGTELTMEDERLLATPAVGGVILFARNFANKKQLCVLVESIKNISPGCLVAVDHEGGRVQRFREEFTRIPAMQGLGQFYYQQPADEALAVIKDIGWLMAAELIDCGIDISFAPILDADESFSDVIGDRAFSSNPNDIVTLAGAFMNGMKAAGMATTGKHFPGHGSVKQDSHLELPVDHRSLAEIEQADLIPFKKLIKQVDALMPAHIVFPQLDDRPVGFSSWWLKAYLRKTLDFSGIVFSDDLSMEGAAEVGGYANRAEMALKAGCDAVLVCNNRQGALEVVEHVSSSAELSVDSGLHKMLAAKPFEREKLCELDLYQQARSSLAALNKCVGD